MTFSAPQLRNELLPSTQLEELFFETITRLATCAHYLGRHLEADPEFTNPETSRRMRLLLTTESKLRAAYEEFRRLKMARQLQLEDPSQAARPLLAVVATHTSRSGFRIPPRPRPMPNEFDRQIDHFILDDARVDAEREAAYLAKVETVTRPAAPEPSTTTPARALVADAARLAPARIAPARIAPPPGRNAACPCNSGLKFKRCCANKQAAA